MIRDALKVLGYEDYRGRCHKAIAGLFYVNPGRPNGGGAGQTIRVCEAEGVPVFLHEDWMTWNCPDPFLSWIPERSRKFTVVAPGKKAGLRPER